VNGEGNVSGMRLMVYEVDYVEGEKDGCSSKVTIEKRIFYVKLFKSPAEPAKYFSGDKNGVQKEISGKEFDFWLKVLADKEADIEDIHAKTSSGKRY
jgi:hypothetical protein